MLRSPHPPRPGRDVSVLLLAALLGSQARAERLPFTTYSTAQGLPSDDVRLAIEDRYGFLWFGTSQGLARFDGTSFRAFGDESGLPSERVIGLLERREGGLLVAMQQGLFEIGVSSPAFRRVSDRRAPVTATGNCLAQDDRGGIWLGVDGLFRLERVGADLLPVRVSVPGRPDAEPVQVLAIDREGSLWIGGADGLFKLLRDGSAREIPTEDGSRSTVTSIAEDEAGRVWVGTRAGLFLARRVQTPHGSAEERLVPFPERAPLRAYGLSLLPRVGGGCWAAGDNGLAEIDPRAGILRTITRREGLGATYVGLILRERTGSLWLLLADRGVSRLAREGFTSFANADGLGELRIGSLFADRSGALVVAGSGLWLSRFDGNRFVSVRPALPPDLLNLGWGWYQAVLQDRVGDWWVPTGEGILRFSGIRRFEDLATTPPRRRYTKADGLPSLDVFRLFEDSRGDIWISTLHHGNPVVPTLSRWNRATDRIEPFRRSDGVPDLHAPNAFLETPNGDLWIGYDGGVVRRRSGVFERPLGDGKVGDYVCGMHLDRRGRLWVAVTGEGLLRVDDPDAERPAVTWITTADGLATNDVRVVTEDSHGRIYVGSSLGVDLLDEATRAVRHLGTADGLPHPFVNAAWCDPRGGLWFGTLDGLALLNPHEEMLSPPPIRLVVDGLQIAGVPWPLAPWGEAEVRGPTLSPGQEQVQLDVVVPAGSQMAGTVRFQFRLDSSSGWSKPTDQRSFIFANLVAGDYRIEVRAVVPGGSVSEPAVVSFQVLAPVWRRAWFVALIAGILGALAAVAYRARVRHLVALERQRTRIAMDLHDEVGSGLGSIGLLADLAAGRDVEEARRRGLLEQIAGTATELSGAMAEIVTAMRPARETIESVAMRLSERAKRQFPGGGARLEVRFPEAWPQELVSPTVARNVLLIGQEALHNASRHARASRVVLSLAPEGSRWRLEVVDDGAGIGDGLSRTEGKGMGLESMRLRAEAIGASLQIESHAEAGTSVSLRFDLAAKERPTTRARAPHE